MQEINQTIKIKILAFGIAKDILSTSSMDMDFPEGASLSEVRGKLTTQFPAFKKLRSLQFAVNEDYQADEYSLNANDEVVIIPPVSGG